MPQTATLIRPFIKACPKKPVCTPCPAEQYQKYRIRRYGLRHFPLLRFRKKRLNIWAKAAVSLPAISATALPSPRSKTAKASTPQWGSAAFLAFLWVRAAATLIRSFRCISRKPKTKRRWSSYDAEQAMRSLCLPRGHNDRRDIEALFHQNDPAAVRQWTAMFIKLSNTSALISRQWTASTRSFYRRHRWKFRFLFAAASAKNWPGWGWFRSRGQRRRSRICRNYQTKLTGTGIGHSTDEELVIAQDAYKLTLWQHRFCKNVNWLDFLSKFLIISLIDNY